MTTIEVKKQKQLSLKKTFDFCLSSIKHRMGRSMLTLSVVVLAVAFFMYLQCSNIFRNSVSGGVKEEIIASRQASLTLGMMYAPYSNGDFRQTLASSLFNHNLAAHLSRLLDVTMTELKDISLVAEQEMGYLNFINQLGLGQRKLLFDKNEGRNCFIYLQNSANYERFQLELRKLSSVHFPGEISDFKAFIDNYNQYAKQCDELYSTWLKMQKQVQAESAALTGKHGQLADYLLSSPANMEKWIKLLAAHKYELSSEEIAEVKHYLEVNALIERVQKTLLEQDFRKKWRTMYGQSKYTKMEEKMMIIDSSRNRDMLKERFSPAELKTVGEEFRLRKELRDLEGYLNIDVMARDKSFLTAQHIYLMVLSFMVCMVGITNAMLMSITERFREIATLKCLGATDSFILVQIMIEASIQGAIGGFCGVIIGAFAAVLNSYFQVGGRLFATFDFGGVLLAGLMSLAAGILLAVLASLYPSTRAARMAPMEAMRVE